MASTIENDVHVLKKSTVLDGVKIAVCSGGGIAAVQLPKLIRELRRHGAHVRVFPTATCLDFIGKTSLEWASAQSVVEKTSGLAEHICDADCVVVFPATADLLAKSALGLCPDSASTLIQSAFGQKKPVIFCPTMHDSLFHSPANQTHLKTLGQNANVAFVNANEEEGKHKALESVEMASEICHALNKQKYPRPAKRVHVSLGGTYVPVDTVRTLSNHSTGFLGKLIAEQLYNLGFELEIFAAQTSGSNLTRQNIQWQKCESYDAMKSALSTINPIDSFALLQLAAISDFEVENTATQKIPSGKPLDIRIKPLPKLLDLPNLKAVPVKVACKLTHRKMDTFETVKEMFQHASLDLLIWNCADHAFGEDRNYSCTLFQKNKGDISHQEIKGKEHLSFIVAQAILKMAVAQETPQ